MAKENQPKEVSAVSSIWLLIAFGALLGLAWLADRFGWTGIASPAEAPNSWDDGRL